MNLAHLWHSMTVGDHATARHPNSLTVRVKDSLEISGTLP
jgi:hypothetical protein